MIYPSLCIKSDLRSTKFGILLFSIYLSDNNISREKRAYWDSRTRVENGVESRVWIKECKEHSISNNRVWNKFTQ